MLDTGLIMQNGRLNKKASAMVQTPNAKTNKTLPELLRIDRVIPSFFA